jgi:hypothetical protein
MEIYKDILGYEGLYKVSNYGNVYSIRKKITMAKVYDKNNYLKCGLYKNGEGKSFLVHRLVAIAFIPNPLNYPQINHKDGVQYNSHVDNLEWCDNSQNQKHRYFVLGHERKERKLNKEQVFKILSCNKGEMQNLAINFNVTYSCVKNVRQGISYKSFRQEFLLSNSIPVLW